MNLTNPIALALRPVEDVLNRNLAESTPGRERLARLSGRSMALRLEGLNVRVRLRATPGHLGLAADEDAADAEVAGAPFALLALFRGSTATAGGNGITISGDPEVLQQFRALLEHAKPELEAELARFVGEAPAHLAGRFAASTFAFIGRLRQTARASLAEYLTEESRDLAARGEIDAHVRDVDRLRNDVERAAARLELLERRLGTRP